MDEIIFPGAKHYALQRLERELPAGLYYHNLDHTRDDVVPAVEFLAGEEGIGEEDYYLLLTAAWFHDIGFIEKRAGHEEVSVRIASKALPGFGYTQEQIQIIKGIILATVVPHSPVSTLEKIMADADLDVFGRKDFMINNQNLRRELTFFGQEFTDFEWYSSQLKFIESHKYFTASAHNARDAGKKMNIEKLRYIFKSLDS